MSLAGNIAKTTFDVLTPDGETERFIFRKFDGAKLAKAAEEGTTISEDDVVTITLKINPSEVSYNEPKITQKVQTSEPGRFVVFDWGTDLLSISIRGNTGNLLPGIVQSGFNPLKGVTDRIVETVAPGDPAPTPALAFGAITPYAQNLMLGSMSYFEILNMSPKYKTFNSLRKLYQTFDADRDVLTLEMGDLVYRGFFTDFTFTQAAATPWNWVYTITFVALANLAESDRRGDDKHVEDETIIDQS